MGSAYVEFNNKIKTKYMGRPMCFFECIGSTNVEAKLQAEAGATHGTVFVADKQTAGRGRRGREWDSPGGKNLYFSLLLKPNFAPNKASMLTLVMAMAVWRSVERWLQCKNSGVNGIKWPNDIVINNKKVCGILTEMSLIGTQIAHVIIGVGINVFSQDFAEELVGKATSIEDVCGCRISREDLLADIMQEFEVLYKDFGESLNLSALKAEYNRALVNCDREVQVHDPKGVYTGTARGINDEGELLVELADGFVTAVYAGEVSVRGIYGYV